MTKRTWTLEEDAYIKLHYRRGNARNVAAHLRRTLSSVRTRAQTIGVQVELRKWTNADTEYLVENYDRMTNKEIAAQLRVNPSVLYNHVASLQAQGRIAPKTHGGPDPVRRTHQSVGLTDFGGKSRYMAQLNIACTPEQKHHVEQLAIAHGLSASAFMRYVIDNLDRFLNEQA